VHFTLKVWKNPNFNCLHIPSFGIRNSGFGIRKSRDLRIPVSGFRFLMSCFIHNIAGLPHPERIARFGKKAEFQGLEQISNVKVRPVYTDFPEKSSTTLSLSKPTFSVPRTPSLHTLYSSAFQFVNPPPSYFPTTH